MQTCFSLGEDRAKQETYEALNFRLVHSYVRSTKYMLDSAQNLPNNTKFNSTRKIVIYTYGYTESFETDSPQAMITAYLQRDDFNIIIFDWGNYSSGDYLKVAGSISKIAELYANALMKMFDNGLNINNLHLVGHSLGAQISGSQFKANARKNLIKSGCFRFCWKNNLYIIQI